MSLTSVPGVNIVGAGLAGSLLAILLAKRGFQVTVYERRPDPRMAVVDGGRSINLALAARGIRGLKLAGVLERVMPLAIPMRGRMVHEHDGSAELQMYGVRPEEVIYSVSRADLNRALIEAAARIAGRHVSIRAAVPGAGARERPCSRCATRPPDASITPRRSLRSPPMVPDPRCAIRCVAREVAMRARRAAGSRLQGADHSRGRRQARDGSERAAHLAARRVHADRAAQPRRHVHRDAVPGAHRRQQIRSAARARRRRCVLCASVSVGASAHSGSGAGILRAPAGLTGHGLHARLAPERRRAAVRRCGACHRAVSRPGHELRLRGLRGADAVDGRASRLGTDCSRPSSTSGDRTPMPSRRWRWRTTRRCAKRCWIRSTAGRRKRRRSWRRRIRISFRGIRW